MAGALHQVPIALTIAGSDSGGGAGIQADLKTFAALGIFGTSAITAVTAQNPEGVSAIQGIDAAIVKGQIRAVLDWFPVGAVKLGMLFSREIIEAVAEALSQGRGPEAVEAAVGEEIPIVVDPVMIASSGARLLEEDALDALGRRIFPLASLITPNMAEAALLAEMKVEQPEHLEPAARAIFERFGVPVLVKGGHLEGSEEATDVLWDGSTAEFFGAPFLLAVDTHGSGCTLSSAIAAYLMRGYPLADAVSEGKRFLHQAMANALPIRKINALNHGFAPIPIEYI